MSRARKTAKRKLRRSIWRMKVANMADYNSAKLGQAVLDYYARQHDFQTDIELALAEAMIVGTGEIFCQWDPEVVK